MKLRVGLIGLGDQWESRHRDALRSLSDRFEVCAICCEVAHRSSMVAKEFGASPIDGFRAMLERNEIDAVLALASDWVGPLPIIAACEAGKAVYSTGAFDLIPEQVDELRRRVDDSGVAFMTELPRRHAPATIRIKELIATRLGQPRLIFCHQRFSVEQQTDRLRRGKYCPVAWRNMMELVDWVCYLTDRTPSSVTSARYLDDRCVPEAKSADDSITNGSVQTKSMAADTSGSAGPQHETYYQMVNLQFDSEDGSDPIMAQISVGHYIPDSWPDALSYRRPAEVQIACENGAAFADLPTNLIWFDRAGQHTESLEQDMPVGQQMLTNFHRSVTSLVRNSADMQNAYRAMSIVLAANESSESGKRVPLNFGD